MKRLEWSNGKYASLGKDSKDNIPMMVVKRMDGVFDGVMVETDRSKSFRTLEEAQTWCEEQL